MYGSSPHTRGAQAVLDETYKTSRIIPAYAGSTLIRPRPSACRRDHPRIRGEHPLETPGFRDGMGSSPHTRGAHCELHHEAGFARIIPAYAGSTCQAILHVSSLAGSSPHTRGALDRYGITCPIARIIPAYAGSTSIVSGAICTMSGSSPHTRGAPIRGVEALLPLEDHPRIRGEHRALMTIASVLLWIIPAYAGSTSASFGR